MKKSLIIAALLGICTSGMAQVNIEEPEFVGTYYHLTSDSTYAVLPKENGSIKKHENKVSKWAKIAKGVSGLASAAGMVGIGTSGSMTGVVNGAKVMSTANGVSTAASSVSALAGVNGMDIVFEGKESSYNVAIDGDMRIVVKADNNETNPTDIYRIVKFRTAKKERRVQWFELSSSLLGTSEAEKNGYVNFTGHKFGEKSYVLTIPISELEPGQYGIFYLSVESSLAVPVATFGIE